MTVANGGIGERVARQPIIILIVGVVLTAAIAASAAPYDDAVLAAAAQALRGPCFAAVIAFLLFALSPVFSERGLAASAPLIGSVAGAVSVGAGLAVLLLPRVGLAAPAFGEAAQLAAIAIVILCAPALGLRASPLLIAFTVLSAMLMIVATLGAALSLGVFSAASMPALYAAQAVLGLVASLSAATDFSQKYADGARRLVAAALAVNAALSRAAAAGLALFAALVVLALDGAGERLWAELLVIGGGVFAATAFAPLLAVSAAAAAPLGVRFVEAESLRLRAAQDAYRFVDALFSFRKSAVVFALGGIFGVVWALMAAWPDTVSPVTYLGVYAAAAVAALAASRDLRAAGATLICLGVGEAFVNGLFGVDVTIETNIMVTALAALAPVFFFAHWREFANAPHRPVGASAQVFRKAGTAILSAAFLPPAVFFAHGVVSDWPAAADIAPRLLAHGAIALLMSVAAGVIIAGRRRAN